MDENVKLKLTNDMAQIEFAVGTVLRAAELQNEHLGPTFVALRAFRLVYTIFISATSSVS